jgi:Rod binding domain-containing protein
MLSIAGTEAAAGAATAAPSPRLVSAAHEFEAQMMQELLKPLSSTSGLDGEDGDADSGSGSALGQFASEALGKALSEQGGFGIASSVVRQLSSGSNKSGTGKAIGSLHERS